MEEVPVIARQLRLVDEVAKLAGTRRIGPALKESVAANLDLLRQAGDALQKLHEVLDLSELESELGGRKANLAYWNSLPPGRYEPAADTDASNEIMERAAAFKTLVTSKSILLKDLRRASLDITSLARFTDTEMRFAEEMGRRFRDFKRTWTLFKKVQQKRDPIYFRRYSYRSGRDFFDLLQRFGAIESYNLSVQREGSPDRQLLNRQELDEQFDQIGKKDQIWIEYTNLNTRMIPLVTGGWFEAFTYSVFDDMLGRLADEHEIYSRVGYKAAMPMKDGSKSDFDIVVGLPGEFILAECKSGMITRDASQRLIANATLLKGIFRKMGVKRHLFMLVFSPTDEEDQHPLLADLAAAGYEIVEPFNIAPYLNAHLMGQPPVDGVVWVPPVKPDDAPANLNGGAA
jgi:hypothetical protein